MHPRELEYTQADGAVGRLRLRWLGTAGYELTAEGHTLLIDPYFTRVGLWAFLAGPIAPDAARVEAGLAAIPGRRVDAIVVGHSHFDHVLDVPLIARLTGARVYGSRSTANLMACAGLGAQAVACRGGEVFEVGPFRVTMTPSEHSRFAVGGRVPYAGEIPCSCELPMRGRDYRCGDVFGIAVEVGDLCLYHMGSANLVDDAIRHRDIDLLLLCIAARHATESFVPRSLRRLRPRLVMPTHYDNFFRPAERPLALLPMTRFGRFVEDVHRFDREIEVRTLPIGGVMSLG